jgi:hypothetical protein
VTASPSGNNTSARESDLLPSFRFRSSHGDMSGNLTSRHAEGRACSHVGQDEFARRTTETRRPTCLNRTAESEETAAT